MSSSSQEAQTLKEISGEVDHHTGTTVFLRNMYVVESVLVAFVVLSARGTVLNVPGVVLGGGWDWRLILGRTQAPSEAGKHDIGIGAGVLCLLLHRAVPCLVHLVFLLIGSQVAGQPAIKRSSPLLRAQ